MKLRVFLGLMLIPFLAFAGVYEDLEEAIIRGDSNYAIRLVQRGMDVNSVDKDGNTLLTQAVRRDMPEFFDFLLKRRARLNVRNRNDETALSVAAFVGNLHYVKRLVEAGAEINFYGWSPLSYAAWNGHLTVADFLIKHGAEVNAKTSNGSTALFFAARFGHIEIVRLLLANKADATIINEHDETAIDWALKSANTDIEGLLRAAGGRSGKSVTIEVSK